jgi:hypothetical protein
MDELTFALIESEREGDEMFAEVDADLLAPTAVMEDADGRRLHVYTDGSYALL